MKLKNYGASDFFINEAKIYSDMALARVISQYNEKYKLVTESGEYFGEVSGKFRYTAKGSSEYPAVGDFVMVTDLNSGNAVIHKVLPRKSCFSRMSVSAENQPQIIAANIDLVFICMSLNNDYNLSRLERYLSAVWDSSAVPVVVLTKSDLCTDLAGITAEVSAAAIGCDIIITSSTDDSSRKLFDYLRPGVTASFVGSSGVGKSTLINMLAGEDLLAVSHIRAGDDKGRHTTTRRELLLLPKGGAVIDTPGMRELGVTSADLSKSFSDIDELADMCRFGDCTHTTEPGCAVNTALEEGRLDKRRFENYLKLKKELRYEGLSSRQIEEEKIKTMFSSFGGIKNANKYLKNKNKNKFK